MVRGETGAQGVTPITIAELRDNGMHGIVTTISEAVVNTTDFPSGGNAVVRGEAGAKGTTPMTMSELRDSATHDVEAEAEKKKIAGAHHRAHELTHTQVIQTTAEPGPPTVKDLHAAEMKADSETDNGRPSAEVGCGRLHQTSAAATTRGCKATLQLATTPKQELKKAKTPAQVEAKARKEARREERKAEADFDFVEQWRTRHTDPHQNEEAVEYFIPYGDPFPYEPDYWQVDTPWGMRLTCDEQAMAYDSAYEEVLEMRENADKQMRAWMEDMGHAETIMNDYDSEMYAHQRAEEAVRAAMREKKATAEANDPRMAQLKMCENGDSDETKRVRSDMGTRAVQELHGQHPSLSD